MASGIPAAGDRLWFQRWKDWVEANVGGGSGVSDGDKGSIIVSGSGTIWTLDPAITAVSLGGAAAVHGHSVFTSGADGFAPASGGGTTNFLRADGSWAAPAGGGGGASATTIEVDLGAPMWTGKFTITDAAITGTSKVLVWQAPGPYTGKGTLADEAELQPVNVVVVEPGAGSAVVKWETPPVFALEPIVANGRPNVTVAAANVFGPTHPQQTVRRINRIGGNVKFSYMVLS